MKKFFVYIILQNNLKTFVDPKEIFENAFDQSKDMINDSRNKI